MLQKKVIHISEKTYSKQATIYNDTDIMPHACLLYFHGGGLLYGSREDLPALHLNTLTKAGYAVIAFDYPLAPAAKLDLILSDTIASVNHYLENKEQYIDYDVPYFLWGRSSGAYLSLLLGAGNRLNAKPAGIISYYGYGFLCDNWGNVPSSYYLGLPPVSDTALSSIPSGIHADGALDTHYSLYVYARQTGRWIDLIYSGRAKDFSLTYTLRTCGKLPCPLFCAHSIGDTDVPYAEFLELCNRYQAKRFIASGNVHDFDRDENGRFTKKLLDETVRWIEDIIGKQAENQK